MARKKKKEEGPKPSAGWQTTFSDMNTLLLTFFVFMYTTAEVEGFEFLLILSAFSGNLGMNSGGMTLSRGPLEEMGMSVESLPAQEKGKQLAKQVKEAVSMFKPEIEAKKVRVQEDERGLVITLMSDNFFESGSADIRPEAGDILDRVAALLSSELFDNMIRIEGHTDNQPVSVDNSTFKNNWELSSARAISVLQYLTEHGVYEDKMSVVGYGDTRPLEGNQNRTPEERAQNRRVEIVVLHESDR